MTDDEMRAHTAYPRIVLARRIHSVVLWTFVIELGIGAFSCFRPTPWGIRVFVLVSYVVFMGLAISQLIRSGAVTRLIATGVGPDQARRFAAIDGHPRIARPLIRYLGNRRQAQVVRRQAGPS